MWQEPGLDRSQFRAARTGGLPCSLLVSHDMAPASLLIRFLSVFARWDLVVSEHRGLVQ
jgi:hypothetical protein